MTVIMNKTTFYDGKRPAGSEQTVSDDVARRWIAAGIADELPDEQIDLDKMTIPELKAYATQQGIELGGATAKSDILAAIRAAEAARAE